MTTDGGQVDQKTGQRIRNAKGCDRNEKKRNIELALFVFIIVVPKGRLELPPGYPD